MVHRHSYLQTSSRKDLSKKVRNTAITLFFFPHLRDTGLCSYAAGTFALDVGPVSRSFSKFYAVCPFLPSIWEKNCCVVSCSWLTEDCTLTAGITLDRPMITSCGTGVTACILALVIPSLSLPRPPTHSQTEACTRSQKIKTPMIHLSGSPSTREDRYSSIWWLVDGMGSKRRYPCWIVWRIGFRWCFWWWRFDLFIWKWLKYGFWNMLF